MSSEQTQADLRRVLARDGYAEVDADQLDALPYGWLEAQGWSLAHKAGTSTYVVYRPREAGSRHGQLGLDFQVPGNTTPREGLEAMRWAVLQTPFSRDSISARIREHYDHLHDAPSRFITESELDDNSYARPPRGLPDFGWSIAAGEPPNQTATAAMIQEGTRRTLEAIQRRLDQMAYGDGDGSVPEYTAQRPDHYRVHPGACVCGFTNAFQRDMEAHLAETVVMDTYGTPRYWKVCESCQASWLCREVVIPRMGGMTWASLPELPPEPGVVRVYRCDNCTRGM